MKSSADTADMTSPWVYASLYAIAVGLAAGLLTFLTVIVSGPFYENGEAWEGFFLTWYLFGLPALLVSTILSVFAYFKYAASDSLIRRGAIYLTNVIFAAIAVLGTTLLLTLI